MFNLANKHCNAQSDTGYRLADASRRDDLTKFPTALVHLFIVFLLSFLHGILSSQVALADTNHYSGDTCFVGFYFAFFLPSLSLATIKVDAPDHASRRDYHLAVNKVATTGGA